MISVGSGTERLSLVVWSLALGDEGRQIMAWSESPRKEMVGGVGLGLSGLHLKSRHTGELFTISRNELALGGADPPVLARSQDARASHSETGKHGCYNLPYSSFLSLVVQPYRPSFGSLNLPNLFLPQDLCTCCSHCLGRSCP